MWRHAAPALLLVCTACSPTFAPPANPFTSSDELLASLLVTTGQDFFETYAAEARVEYYAQGKARKGKLLILAAHPDRLRLEVSSFTDDLVSLLLISADGFTYFERGRRQILTGPLCAAPRVSGIPLAEDPHLLIWLLLGRLPLMAGFQPGDPLTFSTRSGTYELSLSRQDLEQIIQVEPDGKTLRSVSLERLGTKILEISYTGRTAARGKTYARRLRLTAPNQELDLSLEIRDLRFDVPFRGSPFTFVPPRGSEMHHVDCDITE